MTAKVIKEHKSTYPNPIEFKLNDKVSIGEDDVDYPAWVWIKTSDNNEGWAPKEFIDEINNLSKCDYTAKELNINVDEIIIVINEISGWVYVLNSKEESGWIPRDCILLL